MQRARQVSSAVVALTCAAVNFKISNNVAFADVAKNQEKDPFKPKVLTLRSGNGQFFIPGGTRYDGDVKDDMWHGRGRLTNARLGELYDGEWAHGKRNGKGLRVWPTGEQYEGEWKDDLWHGVGKLQSANGDVYYGEWNECRREGWGTLSLASGDLYEGKFKGDLYDGFGTLSTVDESYTGQWRDGLRHGRGVQRSAAGTFEGQFVRDRKHGKGVLTVAEQGMIYEGTWSNDKLTGVGVYHTEAGDSYVGEFVDGRKCGQGDLLLNAAGEPSACARYVGGFLNDKFHGHGTLSKVSSRWRLEIFTTASSRTMCGTAVASSLLPGVASTPSATRRVALLAPLRYRCAVCPSVLDESGRQAGRQGYVVSFLSLTY
jgi:hypothetical protein